MERLIQIRLNVRNARNTRRSACRVHEKRNVECYRIRVLFSAPRRIGVSCGQWLIPRMGNIRKRNVSLRHTSDCRARPVWQIITHDVIISRCCFRLNFVPFSRVDNIFRSKYKCNDDSIHKSCDKNVWVRELVGHVFFFLFFRKRL